MLNKEELSTWTIEKEIEEEINNRRSNGSRARHMKQRFERAHMFEYIIWINAQWTAIEKVLTNLLPLLLLLLLLQTVNSAKSHYKQNSNDSYVLQCTVGTTTNWAQYFSLSATATATMFAFFALLLLTIMNSKMSIRVILCVNRLWCALSAEFLYFNASLCVCLSLCLLFSLPLYLSACVFCSYNILIHIHVSQFKFLKPELLALSYTHTVLFLLLFLLLLLHPNEENIKSTTQWSNDTRHLECCYKIYVTFQQNIYQIYGDAKSWSCSLGCCVCVCFFSCTLLPHHTAPLHSRSMFGFNPFLFSFMHTFVWCFLPPVSVYFLHFKLWISICFYGNGYSQIKLNVETFLRWESEWNEKNKNRTKQMNRHDKRRTRREKKLNRSMWFIHRVTKLIFEK